MEPVEIKEIASKPCTVIHKPFNADWVQEQLAMGLPVVAEFDGGRGVITSIVPRKGCAIYQCEFDMSDVAEGTENTIHYIITTLPALPRHPTRDDAALIHKYMGEGLVPIVMVKVLVSKWSEYRCDKIPLELMLVDENEIVGAIYNNERVEIAIIEGE